MPTQATTARIARPTAECPPRPGWLRQMTMGAGPRHERRCERHERNVLGLPVGKSIPRSISSETIRSSRPPAIERLPIETFR